MFPGPNPMEPGPQHATAGPGSRPPKTHLPPPRRVKPCTGAHRHPSAPVEASLGRCLPVLPAQACTCPELDVVPRGAGLNTSFTQPFLGQHGGNIFHQDLLNRLQAKDSLQPAVLRRVQRRRKSAASAVIVVPRLADSPNNDHGLAAVRGGSVLRPKTPFVRQPSRAKFQALVQWRHWWWWRPAHLLLARRFGRCEVSSFNCFSLVENVHLTVANILRIISVSILKNQVVLRKRLIGFLGSPSVSLHHQAPKGLDRMVDIHQLCCAVSDHGKRLLVPIHPWM
ncbi:hypothetical protein BSKO_12463 [Bryopsis sp. KO-2023]|nr:hypothetical protein BSKO_12463 [Bryopsis sp. KO-2023]